jgi:hypothetical protein
MNVNGGVAALRHIYTLKIPPKLYQKFAFEKVFYSEP